MMAEGGLSEAAQGELMDQCEDQFAQLEKLQNEIILFETDFCEDPQDQAVNRLMATEAELKQWLTVEPKLLASNSEVLLKAGTEEMLKLCSELEMVVSCHEAKRDKLRETKELELKWLEEKKQALIAAKDHVDRLQMEKGKLPEHSVLHDTKVKIQKMKVYQESLMECLGDILEKHIPCPHQNEPSTNKKKKLLMNKVLKTPHDPYVTIDNTFWPPYVEMLLRYGIANGRPIRCNRRVSFRIPVGGEGIPVPGNPTKAVSMATRSERERAQKLNEQHQAILSKMLREEDNKYCADCEAKGPRWASWNLGVFICIRCAGIHRNLGVHISRVKSVNLDQWTSEQIQPKDGKKEREPDRGSKVSSYTKSEESRPVPKISPAKTSEPSVNLLGLDVPAAASTNNGSTSTSQNNNDLDIFGPMVSNPLPASSAAQFSQVSSSNAASTPTQAPVVGTPVGGASSGSGQGDLDLFSDSSSSTKTEDIAKKPLSKDSILSLYGTNSMSQQAPAAGMFMGPSQMPFPVQATGGYQAFPGMGAAMPPTTVMGAMMAQSGAAMMGPSQGMMVGMTMPNGFMGNAPATGVMGMAPRMMGPQGGALPAGMVPAQGMYAIQPGQQAQWNMGQVNQQMSGLALNGAGGQMAFGQPPAVGGWAATGSGQTLSTQLWK
ncbi:hypothetical protein FQN60_012322 [Etheostoma spectabile]|uniref:Arf-GAP domain-containing protein n=1 Tax=Etheostoma spectabile TaxID=54343 RepID=A0A5J5DP22_9PERO|nr:hypothetical protein FQN60_012322 [Etheostoma spectabile]